MLIKKNDIIKRVSKDSNTFYNEMEVGSVGVVTKGPYEKNISDIMYSLKPWLKKLPRYAEIKMVVDVLCGEKMHRYCVTSEYERIKK